MSNVKVNGNTYNDVTSVKLALADGTGYATYAEGAVETDLISQLMNGSFTGEYTSDVATCNMRIFSKSAVEGSDISLNFPKAGIIVPDNMNGYYKNIICPNVVSGVGYGQEFGNLHISGKLDVRSVPSGNYNQLFFGSSIGTLIIGEIPAHNGMFSGCTIGTLVWNNTTTKVGEGNDYNTISGYQGLNNSNLSITNLYVADKNYDAIKALIDAGTLTTVTNLYKFSEWGDG